MEQIKSFIKEVQENKTLHGKVQILAQEGKPLDAMLTDIIAIAKETGYTFTEEQCKDYMAQIQKDSQNNVKLSFSDFAATGGAKPSLPPSAHVISTGCTCEYD